LRNRGAWVAGAALALSTLTGCEPESPAPPSLAEGTLIVAVRPGPTSWFPGPDGTAAGLDHDLVVRFADERGLALSVVEVDSASALMALVAAGKVHLGVGGLYSPPPSRRKADAARPDKRPVLWTNGYYAVEPVLIHGADGFKPRLWRDLSGAEVAYVEGTGIEEELAEVRIAHSEVLWKPLPASSADALIARVAEGGVDFAVVPSIDAAAARNIFLGFDVAFVVGPKRDLAWAVAPTHRKLRDDLDRFFTSARRNGLLTRFTDRYFGHTQQVERIDAGVFQEKVKSVLPGYRRLFEDAQSTTGIEWRLLAALAYQESQWDPFATSETGVRGFMQITEETAKSLDIADRLDPKASTIGAARYIAALKARLPERITEPDRTWLALAAFNIGTGHLEDARVLAQKRKLNPDLWADVKKALPLLALPEYHADAKNGYARGGMPVVFVDRVRIYYDIIARVLPPLPPRLHAFPASRSP
jgi:membrane-bound lytic murein transglycosylase F